MDFGDMIGFGIAAAVGAVASNGKKIGDGFKKSMNKLGGGNRSEVEEIMKLKEKFPNSSASEIMDLLREIRAANEKVAAAQGNIGSF